MRRPLLTRPLRSTLIRDDHPPGGAAQTASVADDPAASRGALSEDAIKAAPDHTKWLLLLLPIVLAAVNPSWLNNNPGHIDPWVYLGYFLHLFEFKSSLFPNLYYGSRLPWILPGYLAYRLFDATVARYVLHFAFYYAAAFSLYALLKLAFGRKNALLGTIVFGTHLAFLSSIGWDYVDGPGITYNLLALACVARAAVPPRRQMWLVFAGIAGVAMFYTNLLLIVFLPFHLAFYLFRTSTGFNRSVIRSMADLVRAYAGGALLLTVALGVINHHLDGNFWFYAPSIDAFRHLSSAPNPWHVGGLAWLEQAYWLGIPAASTVACIAHLVRSLHGKTLKWGDYGTFFILQYLASVAFMIVWDRVGGVGLQMNFYASYLLPSMFLAIGSILAVPADRWSTHAWWPVVVGCTMVFAGALWLHGAPLTQPLRGKWFGALVACAAAALLSRVLFPRRWHTVLYALAGLMLYQWGYAAYLKSPYDGKSTQRVLEGANTVWPYMQKGTGRFWYDITEPHGFEFNGINAIYLWGYTYVSLKFPSLDEVRPIESGETIVVMSGSDQALDRANEALRQRHLKGTLAETHKIQAGGVAYDLSVLEIHDDLPNLRSLTIAPRRATADLVLATSGDNTQLPWSGWKAGSMEQRPEGLLVTTGQERFAFGSWYGPLVAPRSGRYQFTLTYRVLEGRILYGGMTADMSRALGHAPMPPQTGTLQTATYVAQLKAGEGAVLLIANDAARLATRAKYLIASIRAAASFDDDALK